MEIFETKRFYSKDLNWVQHWVSRIGPLCDLSNFSKENRLTLIELDKSSSITGAVGELLAVFS